MERDFEAENREYAAKKLTKNAAEETLTKDEHRLLVEGYGCEELLGIYDNLGDLEVADLSDFFVMERRNGST